MLKEHGPLPQDFSPLWSLPSIEPRTQTHVQRRILRVPVPTNKLKLIAPLFFELHVNSESVTHTHTYTYVSC